MKKRIYKKNTKIFKKLYENLINSRKSRGLNKKSLDFYTEVHHIVPKCLGGTDEDSNLVLLTYREHLIAHHLLSRIYDSNLDLKHVVYFMYNHRRNRSGKTKNVKLTTRELEAMRVASVQYLKKLFTGREIKKEWIEKAKKTKKERYGNSISDKARKMQALGRVGMVFTQERRNKMSIALKGQEISQSTKDKQSRVHGRPVLDSSTGIVYSSLKDCAEKLKVHTNTLSRWISKYPEKGYSYVEKLEGSVRKVVDPEGNVYDSIRQCAMKYGRDGKTIKKWITDYPDKGFKYLE